MTTLTHDASVETTEQTQVAEPGDHDRFAHYSRKDKITKSAVTGDPVIAICGKVWVPRRDPKRFPVCPTCREIHQSLRSGETN